MIQDKNFLKRRLKELAALLNQQIGSFPDNSLGLTDADIDQQIYTATGYTKAEFLSMEAARLEATIEQFGAESGPLLLDFLGNLFYYQYQRSNDGDALAKAKDFYARFQQESGTFSMVYFQRMSS